MRTSDVYGNINNNNKDYCERKRRTKNVIMEAMKNYFFGTPWRAVVQEKYETFPCKENF